LKLTEEWRTQGEIEGGLRSFYGCLIKIFRHKRFTFRFLACKSTRCQRV